MIGERPRRALHTHQLSWCCTFVALILSGCEKPEPTGVQSLWADVAGGRVHYLAAGPDSGRAVVLLHGAKFQAQTWRDLDTLTELVRHGYRALAIDLPGFGQSPRANVDHRTWLVELLDALDVDQPVIVSPSMSGRFALPLVTGHPNRVAGFVALAPVGINEHRDHLSKITAPTLAIWGENDRVVPLRQAGLLALAAPNAQKVIIAGARHAAYLDNPATFHRELLRFLSSLPPDGAATRPASR
jgi:pimeloyl-ACP methyl ester carboxylesterase